MRETLVLADRHLVHQLADPDEARRLRGLVGQDREAAVDLERVGGNHLGSEPVGEALRDLGLAGGGRPEDGENLRKLRHFLWGTPAHHPLRA